MLGSFFALSMFFNIFESPIFLVGLFLVIVVVVIFIAMNIYRYFARKGYKLPEEMRKVILLVVVPKESQTQETNIDAGMQKVQEQISRSYCYFTFRSDP